MWGSRLVLLLGVFGLLLNSGSWQRYRYAGGGYVFDGTAGTPAVSPLSDPFPCSALSYPAAWEIHESLYTDVTGDGVPECVLLVWRPWRDWKIMRWSRGQSPIVDNHDAEGYSAHIILVVPDEVRGYRELWAGSALAVPVRRIAVGDTDGDGGPELVVLEGDYGRGRFGPARYWAVWAWNGFGFNLRWRSPAGEFTGLALADGDGDGSADIQVHAAARRAVPFW